jgi:hypothetical protein
MLLALLRLAVYMITALVMFFFATYLIRWLNRVALEGYQDKLTIHKHRIQIMSFYNLYLLCFSVPIFTAVLVSAAYELLRVVQLYQVRLEPGHDHSLVMLTFPAFLSVRLKVFDWDVSVGELVVMLVWFVVNIVGVAFGIVWCIRVPFNDDNESMPMYTLDIVADMSGFLCINNAVSLLYGSALHLFV